ncbi:efflux RND transporter periplasmic adaptor subunit [Ferruginibacter paludis]|uniref:efflux RND transporter periplasmic adaptor subunit n=1 Tax=Ferruginibacter paludis TaxID=1310417 RepID=UPI0025B5C3EF|nr:efflux RND transporter periplasmic adaptor subunit [Ferruginibacter paludis]MDN3659225.1 efflux RND transporter periplasmic adaptor subunit [Ferruginibacter paludis]
MKKKYILILILLVVTTVIFIWTRRSSKNVQAITFITAKASPGYIAKSITATGTIQPVDTISVGAQVSGVVKKVLVDFNDLVKKGQLLAQVDPSILAAQQDQTQANLTSAKSNLVFQKSTFERQDQLFKLGAISKADYQMALNQFNSAKAAVDNAAAQLRMIQKTLSYTNIFSPVTGVVLNRNVSAGQTIASSFNAPVLFVIAKDLTKMQVNAAVDEADIGGVKTGQNASFTVDAFPDDIFEGTVQEVLLHPRVSANVVTYTTLINVDNAAMKLKPGMTASINIYIEEDSNALLIPSRALTFKPDSVLRNRYTIIRAERDTAALKRSKQARPGRRDAARELAGENAAIRKSYVWIKTGDTLMERAVISGLNDDSYVKIINGLLPEEEVITNTVKGSAKTNADNTQRSPFMPQMQRRPASISRN